MRDFTGAYFDPVGEIVILANFSKFISYNYNSKR